jgi:cysteinyl-tRNA synthetase
MAARDIRLRNSLTRKVEPFEPIDPEHVRLYLCGPTVYDRAHLGNARNVILFDVLTRLLRHDFPRVTYVRNVTDVDDKINARAAETGRPIREITDETLGWFHEDMAALGCLPPDIEPRATEFVPQMVEMIEGLVATGHAYAAEGHVLFSVASYDGYGRLSGRSLDDMIAGARVEVAPYKRDPMDFVLWKPSGEGEPGWPSPWGYGRPGWHIECSAMTRALLGPEFDIHGGGNDLIFPHHENEMAQSCCADPGAGFARVWLHNEMLLVEGRKMSKSLGNFFTVRDLLDRGVPGEVIRFVFLSTHYSKPMDWTEEKAGEAEMRIASWLNAVQGETAEQEPSIEVISALRNDLNTSDALSWLQEHASRGDLGKLRAGLDILGFETEAQDGSWWRIREESRSDLGVGFSYGGVRSPDLERMMFADLTRYAEARRRRDFATADNIRDTYGRLGVDMRAVAGRSIEATAVFRSAAHTDAVRRLAETGRQSLVTDE